MTTKSALDLLNAYGGDSSDEEVPGCRVSTKRMLKDDDEPENRKRFERLPVPGFLSEKTELLFDDITEDSSLHDGRKRSFPHERGNWATYVYIPFPLNTGINTLINTIIAKVPVEMKSFEDFHLSLTRTVILKHHWIVPFINTIKEDISSFKKFMIMFGDLEVYLNDEKTRTFLGLNVKTGIDTLLDIVKRLDISLKEFNLPSFYENPSFHVSIAWCVGDHYNTLKSLLPELNEIMPELVHHFPQESWYRYVETIMCKAGNKIIEFYLS